MLEWPDGDAVPDADADADADVDVELEHAKMVAELAENQGKDFATYNHSLPPHRRPCMRTKRRLGLRKGRDPTEYAT